MVCVVLLGDEMVKAVFLRSFGNYDVDQASDEAGLACDPKDCVTQQQFAEECDINTIVRRFGLTGELPEDVRVPVSGDFTGITDFTSAMLAVRSAQEAFLELPAELRARFENDPQRLMSFMEDPGNRDEAVKLGLVNKPPEVARDGVPVVPAAEVK